MVGSNVAADARQWLAKGYSCMPGPIIVPQRPVARARVKPVQCWAHSKAGKRCLCTVARPPEDATPCIRDSLPVPLCRTHMSSGDGALKVVKHPTFGKILVARWDLPKGYRMVYWGYRKRCGYALDNDGNVIEDRAVSYAPSGSHSASTPTWQAWYHNEDSQHCI